MDPAQVHEALDYMEACFLDFKGKVKGGSSTGTPEFCKSIEFSGLTGQGGECILTIRVSTERTVIDLEHCAPE